MATTFPDAQRLVLRRDGEESRLAKSRHRALLEHVFYEAEYYLLVFRPGAGDSEE